MSKIISISTGVPAYKHRQADLFEFADKIYSANEVETRKLRFLYKHSGIDYRYSIIPDYSAAGEGSAEKFYPPTDSLEPFPGLEQRMVWYNRFAGPLSVTCIRDCIEGKINANDITHLITVSCTGMSAPGLDLHIMELMQLPGNIVRSSVNFMGCYAAVHGLKLADAFCRLDEKANVVVVCTELCTLHFQKENSADNLTSSLLFGDGCAAVLVQGSGSDKKGLDISHFFSHVSFKGKKEMAWELSSKGFLMTLTGYVPELIKEDFAGLVAKALQAQGKDIHAITHWCIHPGGKKILESIAASMSICDTKLLHSYQVLKDYGNMSSPTILFVLKKIMDEFNQVKPAENALVFGAAFGPGLTMETFTAIYK